MIYLDTSVLVAYYLPEPISRQAQAYILSATGVTVSELAQVEFFSALALRQRTGDLSLTDAQRVAALFAGHLNEALYRVLHLKSAVYRLARDYIARFDLPLKAPDALHLAAAVVEQLPLVTADRQLARNATVLGLDVDVLWVD